MRKIAFVSVLVCVFVWSVNAQKGKVQVSPVPAWVTIQPLTVPAYLDEEAESGYIDLDYELQVSIPQQTRYVRRAMHILTEAGVQNCSEISIEYNPAFQVLFFHQLQIVREGKVIDKLEPSRFKILQQEKELDAHLYNGSLTALMMLTDVRKGDVVEYSYSTRGFNPVHGKQYSAFFETSFDVPIYRALYKLVVPEGRQIHLKNISTDLKPTVQHLPGALAYEWKQSPVKPPYKEDNLPSWFDPYPAIHVSEFNSWGEVARWASTLFPFDIPLSAALKEKIESIRKEHATPAGQAAAALRFVQDEIRYLGIEIGVNSHKPNSPDRVLAQRFGDCKDKSYLLCVLLRGLGMEAYPVLINTTYKKALFNWLPSNRIFDHCTVMLRLNSRMYWFDPTINYQRGPLENISFPNYQCGLVVNPNTTTLTTIPLQDIAHLDAKETFTVRSLSGAARLQVKTVFKGSYADNVREEFQSNSNGEMLRKYREYLTPYYEQIDADSISYQDDEATGSFTTMEYYTVNDFWKIVNGVKTAQVSAFLINTALRKPDAGRRTMPFYLSYPARYKEEIVVVLPEDWKEGSDKFSVANASARFQYEYRQVGNEFRLKYEYEHLKDHVLPGEMWTYEKNYKEISKNLAFDFTWKDGFSFASSGGSAHDPSSEEFPFAYLYTVLSVVVVITMIVRGTRKR